MSGPAVAYLMTRFPALSETFVLREIAGLRDAGVDVRTISLRRPRPEELVEPELREWADRTTYVPMGYRPVSLVAGVGHAIGSPPYRRVLRTVAANARRRPRPWTTSVGVLPQAAWVADHLGPEVSWIHAHFAAAASTVAYASSALTGIPFSFTPHAGELFTDWFVDGLLEHKIRAASFVVAISEFNRNYLASVVGEPPTDGRFPLVRYGLPRQWFDPVVARSEATPIPRILSVGRLVGKKGHVDLIRALGRLAREGAEFQCDIVGEGPDRPSLEQVIASERLRERVHLLGAVPPGEVRSLMDEATIFVLAAVVADDGDRDGLPNVLIEAMARGLAVVTTDVTGVPELVKDGHTGAVVPQRDPACLASTIARLLRDPAARARLGTAARSVVVAEYDINQQARLLARRFGILP